MQWTANELSLHSAVSLRTIQRAELAETSMTAANDLAVRRALEAAGVQFIDGTGRAGSTIAWALALTGSLDKFYPEPLGTRYCLRWIVRNTL